VEDSLHYGFEAAGLYGPFSIQGEYITVDAGRESGLSDVGFDGWYLYGSWIVTGEPRSYSVKKGVFGKIEPKRNFSLKNGGTGALELALRYSTIDLNDATIYGGDMDNWTMGVNWYTNPNVRFCFNYITVDSDTAGVNDNADVFQVRAQVVF
jgi:phosphate-selective porin OprO/OprP